MLLTGPDTMPLVLDVEASGLGTGSYPIEVGFVLDDGKPHCTLIRPAPGWTRWDDAAEALHHVSRATLMRHGRSPEEVAYWLNGYLHDRVVYSDGWGQDYAWLALLYEAAGSRPTFRLESIRALLGEPELALWHPTRDRVQRRLRLNRHRASNDARILQQTLMQVRRASDARG